jgi:hypothetical protein
MRPIVKRVSCMRNNAYCTGHTEKYALWNPAWTTNLQTSLFIIITHSVSFGTMEKIARLSAYWLVVLMGFMSNVYLYAQSSRNGSHWLYDGNVRWLLHVTLRVLQKLDRFFGILTQCCQLSFYTTKDRIQECRSGIFFRWRLVVSLGTIDHRRYVGSSAHNQ